MNFQTHGKGQFTRGRGGAQIPLKGYNELSGVLRFHPAIICLTEMLHTYNENSKPSSVLKIAIHPSGWWIGGGGSA